MFIKMFFMKQFVTLCSYCSLKAPFVGHEEEKMMELLEAKGKKW